MRTKQISCFEEIQTLQVALAAWEVANIDSVYVDNLICKYKKDIEKKKKNLRFDFKETIRKKAVNDNWKF